jgi:molybdate transport system substrate-binding protein
MRGTGILRWRLRQPALTRLGTRRAVTLVGCGWVLVGCGSALAGCGSSVKPAAARHHATAAGPLRVSAAASLREAFTRYGTTFGNVTFNFAGSDQLAAQIRAGARPDVFASANTALPDALYSSHLVDKPVKFATNRLVLAVPAKAGRVRSLADATRTGVKLVVGSSSVPVGAYTMQALERLGTEGQAIMARVVSREPSVDGITGKLLAHAADAGFLYVTDVRATKGILRAIPLPAAAQPVAVYEAAVVLHAPHAARAQSFITGLRSGPGQAALAAAGFGPAPAG